MLPEIRWLVRGLRPRGGGPRGRADRRRPRRPAGRAVRPDLLRGGRGQVHVRHGLLHADAHRRRPGPRRGTASSRRSPRGSADGPATYALEGSVAVAGSLIDWLRDNLGIIGDASEVEALARSVPDSGDVVFVPAFSGLFAPHWRSDARGVIAGLTRFATQGPHRPRRARVDGLPGVRPGRGDDRRPRHGTCPPNCGWTAG